jgi:hypothetical protein
LSPIEPSPGATLPLGATIVGACVRSVTTRASPIARPCHRWHGLKAREEALPQEPDARATVALALQELEAVHIALDGAIAPTWFPSVRN